MEIIHTAPELSQNFALTLIDNFAQLVAMTFAEKIQEYVQAQGKPFKAVAYELDVNRRTLYYWMNGKHSPNRALQKVIEDKIDALQANIPSDSTVPEKSV